MVQQKAHRKQIRLIRGASVRVGTHEICDLWRYFSANQRISHANTHAGFFFPSQSHVEPVPIRIHVPTHEEIYIQNNLTYVRI